MENNENQNESQEPQLEITEIDIIETTPAEEKPRRIVAVADWISSHRKQLIIAGIIIVVLGLLWFWRDCFVAATVNGQIISRESVISELERNSGKAVLDTLIKERLIVQEAAKRGVTVSEEEIDAKIKEAEDSLSAQGVTLDQALIEQGLTRDSLRKRLTTQLQLEKMLGDTLNVTDEEIAAYIKENNVTLPKDQEAAAKESLKDAIKNNKLNEEAGKFVDDLMANAKIDYWVKY